MNPFHLFIPIALIGDVGGAELLVILTAILVLFGGKGIPDIARNLGKMSESLRRGAQDFKDQLMEADTPPPVDNPDWSAPYTDPYTEESHQLPIESSPDAAVTDTTPTPDTPAADSAVLEDPTAKPPPPAAEPLKEVTPHAPAG